MRGYHRPVGRVRRRSAKLLAATLAIGLVLPAALAVARADVRLGVPAGAEQLIVVSSRTAAPPAPGYLATLRTYQRASPGSVWRAVSGPWAAETGSGHLLPGAARREGDHATPIGVFAIGLTIYGTAPDPGGLHYAYHRLVCGDWWDEDPFSPRYNQFVHVPCGVTPGFAAWSEALWTSPVAYRYFAVIDFNTRPVIGGPAGRGSGIFLHNWVDGPTAGCVALRLGQLLAVLRWLRPGAHPVIAIGTDSQLRGIGPGAPRLSGR